MAMITYPLNDVMYTAEDAELYNCTRTSGVYSGEDFSCTVSGTNNNVTIGEGIGWIRNSRFSGKVFANKAPVTLALDIADAANPRIDIVAVRFDAATNTTDLVIKKGTAAASPVMPEIVQTESVYELYLYSVYRETAATAITADNVTDLRLDASVCGLMADAVSSVDTSAINAQFTALLEKIKQELLDLEHGAINAYTREETLSPTTKTALGLSEDAVPDAMFALLGQSHLHWWKRRSAVDVPKLEGNTSPRYTYYQQTSTEQVTIYYSDSFEVSNGIVTLASPSSFTLTYAEYAKCNDLAGKYWYRSSDSATAVMYSAETATATQTRDASNYYLIAMSDSDRVTGYTTLFGSYELLSGLDENAYPVNSIVDGYQYVYLAVPFENAREAPRVVTGSYVGTGTYGKNNPCSLTFEFEPKMVVIHARGIQSLPYLWGQEYMAGCYSNSSWVSSTVTVNGNTMSWYDTSDANRQYNGANTTYQYLAIV